MKILTLREKWARDSEAYRRKYRKEQQPEEKKTKKRRS
jgi:hypothetical protein